MSCSLGGEVVDIVMVVWHESLSRYLDQDAMTWLVRMGFRRQVKTKKVSEDDVNDTPLAKAVACKSSATFNIVMDFVAGDLIPQEVNKTIKTATID